MGGLAQGEDAAEPEGSPEVDVSAEGTLVWLRRPNGSWWPSIVISPKDVPDGSNPPPRCPATPIMLLGRRRDGPTFVEWCNLQRCKRVKPFRCGELDFEQRITNALALAAAHKTTRIYNKGRYARMEDAVLHALDIERGRAPQPAANTYLLEGTCSPNPKMEVPNGQVRNDAAARDSSVAIRIQPPSPKRKRKTPYDSEDDAPQGSRRMRDLRDIDSKPVPSLDLSNTGTISALNYDLPMAASQAKRSKQPHSAAKRKHASVDPDQPCGTSRKKDRSRPLSELCNGDMWNGFGSDGYKANEHLMGVGSCSSSSSGTSSLDTPRNETSCHSRGSFRTDKPKGTEISCMTALLSDDFPRGDDFIEAPLFTGSILEEDHLQTDQPCPSTKNHTWKPSKHATDCCKANKSPQCDRRNFKMKTLGSVDQECNNRTRESNGYGHHKTRIVNHETEIDEVVLLKRRLEERTSNKPTGHDAKMHVAVVPSDLNCVGAVQQQHSGSKRDPEESSEIISSRSNCESGSVSSLVFELPLQVLPPQHKAFDREGCRVMKPIKTLELNSNLYDVELSALGSSSKGRRVPLVSLMSKWNRRPVVGYPVSVEVCDDVFRRPSSRRNGELPTTTISVDEILKRDEAEGLQCLVPQSSHTCQAKARSRRKSSDKEVDKLWQPHTKKPASSSRKMRRLSSFASGQRDGDGRKSAAGNACGTTIACIPLRVVFSRINGALSFPVK